MARKKGVVKKKIGALRAPLFLLHHVVPGLHICSGYATGEREREGGEGERERERERGERGREGATKRSLSLLLIYNNNDI